MSRSTPGVAPTSRSQSPTLSRSSRLRSGQDHGSSGSIEATTFSSAASTSSCDARSAVGAPGRPVADVDRVAAIWRVISPGSATYDAVEGQPELLDQPEVAGVGVADHLAAELDEAAVGELDLLDAPADPGPGLEHRDLRPAGLEVAAAARPARPAPTTTTSVRGSRQTTVCSGSQPSSTRSPAFQRSSARIRGRFCSRTVRVRSGAIETRYWVVAPW